MNPKPLSWISHVAQVRDHDVSMDSAVDMNMKGHFIRPDLERTSFAFA
jgi:hypothetical protein